jgi:excisionase family DNA binding protein
MTGPVSSHKDVTHRLGFDPGTTTDPLGTKTGLPTLIDVEALAGALGVGVRQIRRLVEERRIPFVKVGRYVRFDVDDVARWVDEHRFDECRRTSLGRRGR